MYEAVFTFTSADKKKDAMPVPPQHDHEVLAYINNYLEGSHVEARKNGFEKKKKCFGTFTCLKNITPPPRIHLHVRLRPIVQYSTYCVASRLSAYRMRKLLENTVLPRPR